MNEKATAGGKLKHNIPTLVILIVSGAMCYAFPYFRSYYYDTYMEAFGFNDIQMGVLGSAYGSFAILAYFLGGFCADRWPAKNLLALSMLVSGVLGLALLAYPPFWVVFAIHAVWGITTILTFWDALVKALRTIASEDEQGRVFGLFEGGRGATNMIQSALILAAFGLISAKSGGKAGISMIIIIYAVIYILLGVLILLCYKEPEFKRETHAIVNVPQLKKVLKMPTTWLQSAIIFCSYAMCCSYFYVTPYAQEVFGATAVVSAACGYFSQYIRPIGCVVAGFAADRIGSSKVCAISFVVMILSTVGVLFTPGQMSMIWMLLISIAGIYASMYACQSMHFAIMEEGDYPHEYTGTAVAIITPIGYSVEAISSLVAGYCLATWDGAMGYKVFFGFLLALAVIGLICNIAWMNLTKAKRMELAAKRRAKKAA